MILRESSNTFLVSPKFFALSALILAFPPVFTSFSKADGLKVSLALVLLYLIRGLVTLASAGRPKLRPFFQFVKGNIDYSLSHSGSHLSLCRDPTGPGSCLHGPAMDPRMVGASLRTSPAPLHTDQCAPGGLCIDGDHLEPGRDAFGYPIRDHYGSQGIIDNIFSSFNIDFRCCRVCHGLWLQWLGNL